MYHNNYGNAWYSGGRSAIDAICANGFVGTTTGYRKAGSWVGGNNNVGFSWEILVAHELGHLFGANHTHNGTGGSCPQNDNGKHAYEIASGTTIMSYRNICEAEQNIPSSGQDDYFHTHNIEEMLTKINSVGCAIETNTNNEPPIANADPCNGTYTLPIGTPFTLTGGAADSDSDFVTYCWEQFDEDGIGINPTQGKIDTAAATDPLAPLFRSIPPNELPARTFPSWDAILKNNNVYKFEALPLVSRTLTFRLTARDNSSSGGGVSASEMSINVDGTKGPLQVNSPNGGETASAGTLTVTWLVSGTNSLVPNVNIWLSVNGGTSFPYLLLGNTPNDGNQSVTLPNSIPSTSQARIMVECVKSNCFKFFDVSNNNFSINTSCGAITSAICPMNTKIIAPAGSGQFNLAKSPLYANLSASPNSITLTVPDTGPTMKRTYINDLLDICESVNPKNEYVEYPFTVDKTGTYRFLLTSGAQLPIMHILEPGFDPNNLCPSIIETNATFDPIPILYSIKTLISVQLEACKVYSLVLTAVSEDGFTKTINISSPETEGRVYPILTPPTTGYSYTYVAFNEFNDRVAKVNNSANFTDLPTGDYEMYGVHYDNTLNPTTFLNKTLQELVALGCVNLTGNQAKLTVTSPDCTITIAGASELCANGNTTYVQTGGAPGGVWAVSPPGAGTISPTGIFTANPSYEGTAVITYSTAAGMPQGLVLPATETESLDDE